MKIAVKLYKNMENPEGIPENWPAETYLFDEKIHTPTGDYIVMTEKEFDKYKEQQWNDYDEWQRRCEYEKGYEEKRLKEYPSHHEILMALMDVVKLLYIDETERPEKIKKVIDKINQVDSKYPKP